MPRRIGPARRVKFNEPPFNRLPIVEFHEDGTILVRRGTFDTDTISHYERRRCTPGIPMLVFTNRLGQHWLRCRGDLVGYDEDLTKLGRLANAMEDAPGVENLDDVIAWHHDQVDYIDRLLAEGARSLTKTPERRDWHLERITWLEHAKADGWVFDPHPDNILASLRDTKPGPSFAPDPQHRRRR